MMDAHAYCRFYDNDYILKLCIMCVNDAIHVAITILMRSDYEMFHCK